MNPIAKNALISAVSTVSYIALVAFLMFYGFKASGAEDSVIIPITMLLLFVFSAAFTGTLVFGRPILWYLDGRKQEAVTLFITTLLMLLVLTLAGIIALLSL